MPAWRRRCIDTPAGPTQWVYVASKRPHTHDVRGLVLLPSRDGPETDLVASCANDAQVVLYR